MVRPALREHRTWSVDSSRWRDFRPRPDDIVIATYPKCAAMRKIGDTLLGGAATGVYETGGAGFFFRGENDRWRAAFRAEDLALYDAKIARPPPDCARWLLEGRAAVDPSAPERG